MPNSKIEFGVYGNAIHTRKLGEIENLDNVVITVDEPGVIEGVLKPEDTQYESVKSSLESNGKLFRLNDGQYLLPGLVDLHIHAPQWPQLGKALHLPLYQWLNEYTFPLEAKYTDFMYAQSVYSSLVDTLLANGTTTAVYFGTIHLAATQCLVDICMERGQRAVVGKVVMDNKDECPDYYRDASTQTAIDDTRTFIEYVLKKNSGAFAKVKPAVTPRFIPSCTDEGLTALGALVNEYDCHVQTHCSESDWEHGYVLNRHCMTDTGSLYNFDLVTDKTVLAHCNFIDDADMDIIKSAQAGISHCPLSNYYFSNAVFPARRALDKDLLVGMGTDVSGGPSASILDNCSHAINASRALEEGVNPALSADERGTPNTRLDFKEAFWMATSGGAQALKLNIGQFTTGYAFDAVLIDTTIKDSNLVIWPGDTRDDVLEKIIYSARRQNIRRVWVQGKPVHEY